MKLVFASNNMHKLQEIRSLMPAVQILSLKDIGCDEDIEETELTLEGNAKLKADYVQTNYGYDCFADDTGLEVEWLNGAPGVFSARYAGKKVTYEDNVKKLLKEMQGAKNRNAAFRTVIALNLGKEQFLFEGVCKGKIIEENRGKQGFGYDPVFQPTGFEQTFAEMNLDDKGKISHRGLAIQKLVHFLKENQ
ncbi:non-canonical purine NTP diphosphatase [Namhaeicola litoreus]|uniref:dITP/XTP pyrophosphatase n=1 Tax=Namhaeicola litoreus TaxID=1052145 RepID=A0ABW3Y5U5_9FLAO